MAKFKLTSEVREFIGVRMFRIEALIDIPRWGVKAGDKGGYVEREDNIDQSGDAWVYGNARVYGYAWVCGNALCQASRSDGCSFCVVATPEGPRVIAGSLYSTFDDARSHFRASQKGTMLENESLALVDHLEQMAKIRGLIAPVSDKSETKS